MELETHSYQNEAVEISGMDRLKKMYTHWMNWGKMRCFKWVYVNRCYIRGKEFIGVKRDRCCIELKERHKVVEKHDRWRPEGTRRINDKEYYFRLTCLSCRHFVFFIQNIFIQSYWYAWNIFTYNSIVIKLKSINYRKIVLHQSLN